MKFISFDFLLKAVKGSFWSELKQGFESETSDFSAKAVSIDSREDLKEKIFVALKGQNFDGHDFLYQAWQKGAVGFIVSDKEKAQAFLDQVQIDLQKPKSSSKSSQKLSIDKKNIKTNQTDIPLIIFVPDTLKALQDLAQQWIKKQQSSVIAITGSNGKTSTRAFTQSLMASQKPFASPKSYNNFIGVPLSLLSVNRENAFLIQEIGTNALGEIAFLTKLCSPKISAITMLGPSHLEGLGSLERIVEEKKEIYLKSPQALWIFNRDNPLTEKLFQELGQKHKPVLTFSSHKKDVDVSLRFVREESQFEKSQSFFVEGHIGSVSSKSKTQIFSSSNLENLMCACACALGAGLDPQEIWKQIPFCQLPKGRGQMLKIKDKNISLFFDAYNANPSSMDLFFESCERLSQPKQRLFVLGDMKELGEDSDFYHKKLAEHPVLLRSRFIVFIGEYGALLEKELKSKGFKGFFRKSKNYDQALLSALKKEMREGDFIALKASRSLKLEKLVYDLSGQKIF